MEKQDSFDSPFQRQSLLKKYTESENPPSRFSVHTNYNNLNSLKSAFSPRNRGASGFHKLNSNNEHFSPRNLNVPSKFVRSSQRNKTVTFSNSNPDNSSPHEEIPHSHFFKLSNPDKSEEAKTEEIKEEKEEKIEKKTKTHNALYNYLQDFLHFTLGRDDDEDVHHRIEEETKLKKELTEIPQLFRQHTKITNKRRPDFLKVITMNKIEKVYVDYEVFPDKYPLKQTRKHIVLAYRYFEHYSILFVKSSFFEIIFLTVILMNCITYILKQNQQGEYFAYLSTINRFERVFVLLYLIEMCLKMVAFGVVLDKHSYFRDGWNILDFFVIINLVLLDSNISSNLIKDYSLLRILRLLRPLKALTRFSQLRAIINSLFAALPLLLDFLSILIFFFLIYAAIGLHIFGGLLLFRCYDIESGLLIQPELVCGNAVCPNNSVCIKGLNNLEGGVTNFDNLLSSLLQVMLISTLDNWTSTMYNIQRAFTNYAWIYFVSLVIFGNYILLNLTLALIKVKFSETHKIIKSEKKKISRLSRSYDFMEIKRQGLWIGKRKMSEIVINKNINTIISPPANSIKSPLYKNERSENKESLQSDEKNMIKLINSNNDSNDNAKNRFSEHSSFAPGNLKKNNQMRPRVNSSNIHSRNLEKRRGAGAYNDHSFITNKSKTVKSYKSHFSSVMTKRNNNRVSPVPSSQTKKSIPKYDTPYLSSESMFSFVSMDEKHANRFARTFSRNRCLKFLYGLFGRLVKKFPLDRRKKHQTIFHLEPKYLKLIVDYEKEYVSSSEKDILPNKDQEQKNKAMMEQWNLIKKKKLQIIYAPKKKKASLLKFLKKIYSKKIGSTNSGVNPNINLGKDIILYSSNSNSSINSLEEKIFKTAVVKKGIPLKNTRRMTTKKKDKTLTNVSMKSQNKVNELDNYIFNIHDLFGDNENAKDKNPQAKSIEKMKKKLNDMFRRKSKKNDESSKNEKAPYDLNNYVLIKNLINENIEENEEEKDKDLIENENLQSIDMAKKYLEIRKKDLEHNNIHSYTWSGDEVLPISFMETAFNKIFQQLNDPKYLLYYEKAKGFVKLNRIRGIFKRFLFSRFFNFCLVLLITSYMIFIALSSSLGNEQIIQANSIFTGIFLFEMFLKIIGYGWRYYLNDIINKVDLIVVWASLIEIILLSNSSVNEYRYIRFLTAIKVFRIARVIQHIKFIKFLISVISRTLSSFIYLALLLILLNFVYALVGMEVFGGKISINNDHYFNINFDTFWVAFLSVFNIVTLDNWIDLIREGFNSSVGVFTTSLFVISWIIIGNFLLLNLFLAIMLDGFTVNMELQELQQIIDEEQEEKEKNEKKKEDFNIIIPKDARQGFVDEMTKYFMYNSKYNEKYNEKETKLLTLLELDIIREKTQSSAYQATNYLPYSRIQCEISLWIWEKNSEFRQFCHKIIYHLYFQNFMIFIVIFSTVVIILKTYVNPAINSEYSVSFKETTDILDYLCLAIFVLQAFLKIVVLGFIASEKSYARSFWNKFDLYVLACYFAEFWFTNSTENFFFLTKLIKIGKAMRPFSLINYYPNIYTVSKALWESLLDILKVLFVIFIIWFTFALLGIILFRGRFGYCEEINNFGINKETCLKMNKKWMIFTYNFDNIYNAFITLFVISTYDGWNEIMSVGVNSDLEINGPHQFNNQYSSYCFFLSFVIFGAMFLINLFTGVIFYNFTMAEKLTRHKYLSDSQVTWLNLHKLIILADPYYEYSKPPSSFSKRITFNLIRARAFRSFIYFCLIINIVILLLSYNDMSSSTSEQILYAHQIFNLIFLIEGMMKIFVFGFKGYIFDDWHKLDFFIIVTGVWDFMLTFIMPSYIKLIRVGPQIIKGLRIVRILRAIRLLRKKRGIDKLLHTLMFSLPMVLNIFTLLIMFYYVYAMFGCYIFAEIPNDDVIDDYINFRNFSYSIMTLYKVSTADGWEDIMMRISNYYPWATLYFISFYIITTFILINLLVLVLLQQFENYHLDPGNPIHTFKDYLLKFRKIWGSYTSKQRGKKIHHRMLISFFKRLPLPLGFDDFEDTDIILKNIMEMKFILDSEGYITFNEILYATLKRAYHRIIYQNNNELAIKQLELADEKTRFNLQMKKEIKKKRLRRLTYSPQEITEYLKNKKEYNPLINFFYARITFYALRNYTDIVFEKLIQIELKNNEISVRKVKQEEDEISEYSENNILSDSSSEESNEERDKNSLSLIRIPQMHFPSIEENQNQSSNAMHLS